MNRRESVLEPLLRIRRNAELRRAVVVADAERSRLAAESAKERAGERVAAARESLREALEGPLDSALLRLTAQGAFVEERHRRRAAQALTALAPVIARAREALAEASAQRKAVEWLRERRRTEERLRAERLEQAALDEIAARSSGGWG